jgi:hypothetical protein
VSTIEELLGRNSSGSGLENREYDRGDPLRWPRDTIYSQKVALTSPTCGGRSVGIIRLRAKTTEFVFCLLDVAGLRSSFHTIPEVDGPMWRRKFRCMRDFRLPYQTSRIQCHPNSIATSRYYVMFHMPGLCCMDHFSTYASGCSVATLSWNVSLTHHSVVLLSHLELPFK